MSQRKHPWRLLRGSCARKPERVPGRLYYAKVTEMAEKLQSEIQELAFLSDLPEDLTYPQIQPHLFNRVRTVIGMADN